MDDSLLLVTSDEDGLISGTSDSGLFAVLVSSGLTTAGFGGERILDKDRPKSTLSKVADSCITAESMTHAFVSSSKNWIRMNGQRRFLLVEE